MTTTPTAHARAASGALEALARATIANTGSIPVGDLYAIASELVDVTRHLSQVLDQLGRHLPARAERVGFRLDAAGWARYPSPTYAVGAARTELAAACTVQADAACTLLNALEVLSTLAEVRDEP